MASKIIQLPPPSNSLGMKGYALAYASGGWRCFPVFEIGPSGVCSCEEGAACGRPGKHPRVGAWPTAATTDWPTIEAWWSRWPHANIGLATGRESDLTVLDADTSSGKPGLTNLTKLCAAHGGIPATGGWAVKSGGGGVHLYFAFTEALPNGADILGKALDIRSEGGYIVAPPSNHASGGKYEWREAQKGLLSKAPDWLTPAIAEPHRSEQKRTGPKRSSPGYPLERIESMLRAIDPEDRDFWLAVGVIMGRLYFGTALEGDAWSVYEAWSARSPKFDQDRSGNLERMREMFNEASQKSPRAGGRTLSVGTIVARAKESGWLPFGDRERVKYEPGNESAMLTELVGMIVGQENNNLFESLGVVIEVLRTKIPLMRMIKHAHERGAPPPEGLIVRPMSAAGMLDRIAKVAVLEALDKSGAPSAVPCPPRFGEMVLKGHSNEFQTLSGIAEWPMLDSKGELIWKQRGYDPETGFYFNLAPDLKLNERLAPEEALRWVRTELLADFPFEQEEDFCAALGLFLSFMQRPLMKTCPAFAVVAPQIGTGKSTLVELASLTIHGQAVAMHPWPDNDEEFRKAMHSLLVAKLSAVLFDNIGKGRLVRSDHFAKLITAETAADRTLGATETTKQTNTLLLTLTGNNINFADDLASRVMLIKLNAKMPNPLRRKFRHKDIRRWASDQRNATLSALIAIARAGLELDGASVEDSPSRFEDFDALVVRAVLKVTGCDIRDRLLQSSEAESEEDAAQRGVMEVIGRWQQFWRGEGVNGTAWRVRDLIEAIERKTFDENSMRILRAPFDSKSWETNPAQAMSYLLRSLNGDHRFEPMVLTSHYDANHKVNLWSIAGLGDSKTTPSTEGGF